MKQPFLLLILAIATFLYFQSPAAPPVSAPAPSKIATAHVAAAAGPIVVAPAPSSYARWKTGVTAQNDWKTGPNAQTDFEPFAPSEQVHWNDTPGSTVVSGVSLRR